MRKLDKTDKFILKWYFGLAIFLLLLYFIVPSESYIDYGPGKQGIITNSNLFFMIFGVASLILGLWHYFKIKKMRLL